MHATRKRIDTVTILAIVIALVLLGLNIARIVMVPVSYDEAVTFLTYVHGPYKNIITNTPITTSNHILNSLATKVFTELIHSETPFVLRFANLLAQAGYIVYSYQLSKKLLKERIWVLAGFLLLNLNSYMFEFWGLCRGYGLSVFFMIATIYHLLTYIERYKIHHLIFTLCCGVLAAYSNFVLLNVYLGIIGVIILNRIIQKPSQGIIWKQALAITASTIILYILIAQQVMDLYSNKQLYFGEENGFVQNTIYSLLAKSLNAKDGELAIIITAYIISISTIFLGIYWAWQLYKNKISETLNGVYIWVIIIVVYASVEIQHLLLDNKYIMEREGLFLITLYHLVVLSFLRTLNFSNKKIVPSFLLAVIITVVLNFVLHYNTITTRDWNCDMYNIAVLNRIVDKNKNSINKDITIRPLRIFTPSLKYYIRSQYPRVKISIGMGYHSDPRKDIPPDYYYYIDENYLDEIPPVYKVDTTFQHNQFILLRKQ